MIATTVDKPAVDIPNSSASPGPLRLRLAPPGTSPALIDGAWWPHSRDLTAELPALVALLDPLWGRITRVTVNPALWPVIPRKVPVQGHVVKVGWFEAEQDPHALLLLSYTAGRWDVLVVPPETDSVTAARLLAAGADPTRQLTPSALLLEDDLLVAAEAEAARDMTGEKVWENEGGHEAHQAFGLAPATTGFVPKPADGV
ncbi:DUF5994 family protein [Streptomyces sp. NPDC007074]|uniref:DUF5994 family protein n=1 Tax=Streptomyces sp. NPDC007074 TaxID=3156764 RepID=UPI0033C4851A